MPDGASDPNPRRTGLREVAKAAGVSMMTVSRAMRGVDGVSESTRRRIADLAQQMGYVPDGNARALAATNSRLIGISLPNLFNDVFAGILDGMRRTLHGAGYSTVIDTTDYDPDRELDWLQRMTIWRPAAVVLTGRDHHPELAALVARAPMPVVEIWDAAADPIDLCVGLDHRAAGRDLGRHVASLGYRRPAFVGPPPGLDTRADKRVAGIAAAFDAALHRVATTGDSAFGAGAAGFARAMDHWPDVVFFHNDNTAFGGLMAAQKAGLDVPGDVGIAGFNALDLSAILPRPLTTMATPRRQIGQVAARHLLARLNGIAPPALTALPCTLVPGATTRRQD
ncbi:LacI family DNA-binding transcriptional regulator [Jannaschia sp. LMIT008]|uniref:LacI family DNA-binding transcriptional regulator n=1 Tax=Jannaschia maritima TaxID=3032585 RepID=UPI002810B042|nr:LacI family DNA-binding transcriptional regulator [Jannaschia sp. LMIT008]